VPALLLPDSSAWIRFRSAGDARTLADRHGLVCARIEWDDAQVLFAYVASKEPMFTVTVDGAGRTAARRVGVSLDEPRTTSG